MNPIVFWAAFIGAIFIAAMLSGAPPHNVAQIAGAVLAWTATIAMAWARWVGRPNLWLGRIAAAAVAVILIALVHDWLPRDDVFVVYRRNCPPRLGTFWPLVVVWGLGLGAQTIVVWGISFRRAAILAIPTLRSAVWWLCVVAWSIACALVFARNISVPVASASLLALGKFVGALALMVAIPVGVVWLLSRPARRARKHAQADYLGIAAAMRADILAMIDRHARSGSHRLLYRAADDAAAPDRFARIGGDPLAATHEAWPRNEDGSAGIFLLQLPMTGIPHAAWHDRLVTVYLARGELLVRSYPQAANLVAAVNAAADPPVQSRALRALALPSAAKAHEAGDEDASHDDLDGDWLIEQVPGLGERLARLTSYPGQVLSMLLSGQETGEPCDVEEAILVGGEAPILIQGAHDPACPQCHQPMRFLFQFGDVTETFEMGDCGVGYVYGCDTHPECCEGFVDCY